MDLRKIIYVIRAIGFSGILRTVQYGFLRDRLEKRPSDKLSPVFKIVPGNIKSMSAIDGGVRLEYDHAGVEIIYLYQDLIKVSWEPGKPPIPYTIAKSNWEPQIPDIISTRSDHPLTCGNLIIRIDNTGGISFENLDGIVFRKDNPPVREGDEWSLSTHLAPDEHIYGLGERASTINLRPGNYCSWNTDAVGSYSRGKDPLYIGTPIYLSLSNSGSYLTYFENSYRSIFNIEDTFKASFSGGMLRYYLIFGSLETIFSRLSELVGLPCMPPRWALGYHQSRWGYQSEEDLQEVVKGFEEHYLPLSVIHLDIDYMDKYRVFTVNTSKFPRISQLSDELEEKGIRLVASINPAIKLDGKYKSYKDGLSKDVYCKLPNGSILHGVSWPGWSAFPDFSNPEARKWWQEQYPYILDEGISGIWHDMNEPSSFAGWGDKTLPITTTHYMDGKGGNHLEAHNLYGLLMNKAGYEALQKYSPDKRPWIFSRSGWAGLQRYAWTWTGDVETSWEALRQTIPTILGLGISGHAFSGVDIGGFRGSPEPELYLRWFQMATFFPLFRTHSAIGTKPREPWVFGEPLTSIVRKFLELRYQLIPYLYTLAWKTAQTGYPPIRPLFWENPQDLNLWDIEDEFLVGDVLLIAPILYEKAHTRKITLPPGLWYSFWDDRQYQGPSSFDFQSSLEMIPIFIKGGTLFPMDDDGQICFHVYPGNNIHATSQYYNDAGDGYGPWRVDTFKLISRSDSMEILWDFTGDYPFPYSTVKFRVHGKRLVNAVSDGNPRPIQDNTVVLPKYRTLNLEFA